MMVAPAAGLVAAAAPPACPEVKAAATGTGPVLLQWAPVAGATGYVIHRAAGDGPLEPLTSLDAGATHHLDTSARPGTTYHYVVRSLGDGPPSPSCGLTQVTSIPFFPAPMTLFATSVGLVLVIGVLRRVHLARGKRRPKSRG